MLGVLRLARTALLVPLLLAAPVPVRAGSSDDSRAAARVHYARGLELAAQGGYEAALQQFNQAYAISPQYAVLYNIGQAEVALDRPTEAIATFSAYLREGQDRLPEARRQQVRALIAVLQSHLAELSIATDRPNAQVSIDGRQIGATPLADSIHLAPGAHQVSIVLEGAAPVIRTVVLRDAEHQTIVLELPSPAATSATSAADAARAAVAEAVAAAAAAARAAARAQAAARVATAAAQSPAERARSQAATRAASAAARRGAEAAAAAAAAEMMARMRATPAR